MKVSQWVLSLALLTSLSAFAQGRLSSAAQNLADKVQQVEAELHPEDARELSFLLDRADRLLSRYDARPGQGFTCVSNGDFGNFERFLVASTRTGETLGGGTSNATCQRLLRSQKNGLICISNGDFGNFEKFAVYSSLRRGKIGGETSLANCERAISTSSSQLVCVSNGDFGNFEKFTLTNFRTGQSLGGETNFETCLRSVR